MGYSPILVEKFEALGATWTFRHPDKALTALIKAVTRLGLTEWNSDTPPVEILDELVAIYDDGIVDWSGVTRENGDPLPCNRDNALAIPTVDKVTVAGAYLAKRNGTDAEMGQSAEQPTGITPQSETDGPRDTEPQ